MDEWKEGVWLGISAFLTAMLITFAVVLGSVAKNIARMQQKDIDTVAVLQEDRKWIKYNNVKVKQADVINCILENRTRVPAVAATVNTVSDTPGSTYDESALTSGSNYKWDGTNPPADYSMETLNDRIPPGATYRAHLIQDANGVVLYIWFRRIT